MSCTLTSGYTLGCRDNIGGVQEVYVGDWNGDSMTFGLSASGAINSITGVTVSFYAFEQELETGSFTQNGVFSTENGTAFYEQTCQISLHKLDSTLRNQLYILGQGKWRVIIKDQRGTYWLMGYQNPVRVTESTPGVGKAYGDMNGAIVTFMGKEPHLAYEIEASTALTVIST